MEGDTRLISPRGVMSAVEGLTSPWNKKKLLSQTELLRGLRPTVMLDVAGSITCLSIAPIQWVSKERTSE